MSGYPNAIRHAFECDEFARALALADRALADDENDGRIWELKGLTHHAQQDFVSALAALETAQALVPLNPAASVCLGQCYGRTGHRELSRSLLESLVDNDRLTCELLLEVAAGLDTVDCPQLSMVACRRASQRDPLAPQVYYDMGFYAARCGQPQRIVESLARKALSLDPGNMRYRLGLASLLAKSGRERAALAIVRKFTRADIDSVRCRCCLQRVVDLFEAAGDLGRAAVCRERLWKIEQDGTEPDCD